MHPDIRQIEIENDKFSPIVLECLLFTQGINFPQGYRLEKRYVYDYEIEYFLYSTGGMMIEGNEYPVRTGDIVFRRPGQLVQGIMPYKCYLICFDLLGNTGKSPHLYDFSKEQEFQDYYINPVLDAIPHVFHNPYEERYHKIFDRY